MSWVEEGLIYSVVKNDEKRKSIHYKGTNIVLSLYPGPSTMSKLFIQYNKKAS